MLAVGDAGWQAWGRRRSSAALGSSGPRVAVLRLLLLHPRLRPHGRWRGGSSRAPSLRAPVPGRVTAASRPTSSAPIGCRAHLQRRVAASGPGRGGAAAAPSRAGKGRATLRNPPRPGISLHVSHVGSLCEGGKLSPGAHSHAWRLRARAGRSEEARNMGESLSGLARTSGRKRLAASRATQGDGPLPRN